VKRLLVVLTLIAAPSPGDTTPDPNDIIQQSVGASHRNLTMAPEFDYYERQLSRDGSKTYQVTMMSGTPYRRLTEINGQPLSPDDHRREQQKEEAARAARAHESPDERAKRLDKYARDNKRNRMIVDQLTQAFQFARENDQSVGGYDAYVLHATPRPNYQPPTIEAEVLSGMEGRFWIDQKSYQWVKVEVTVIRPVWIVGFLAKVETGTQFTLEQTPVASNVWLPAHFTMKTRGRLLLLFKQRSQIDATFFDYRRVEGTR
jgi:hypothetical protein